MVGQHQLQEQQQEKPSPIATSKPMAAPKSKTDCGAEVQAEVHDVEAEIEAKTPAEGNDPTEAECTAPAAATGRTACIVIKCRSA